MTVLFYGLFGVMNADYVGLFETGSYELVDYVLFVRKLDKVTVFITL